MLKILVALILISQIYCLYDRNSKVQVLDKNSFKQVTSGSELWMVEFFAPWCGHCKSLAPEYDKLAKLLDGIVNIGAVDMDANPDLGSPYGIKGFPTLKFFGDNKNSPTDYQGERTAQAMAEWITEQVKKTVRDRVSGKSKGQERSSRSNKGGNSGGSNNAEKDNQVIILEDGNFDENVLKSKDNWFVEFYAPWCGHCKKLEPEWNRLATELKGQVKVAKVDATVHTKLGQRFGISGYPTIKFFPAGMTSDGQVIDYNGARDTSSMAAWAREQGEKFKPLEITQLLSQEVFDEYCVNFNGVCIVVFLPHIYDSSKSERNDYLKILEDGATVAKGKPLSFLWAQGGDNYEFEEAFQSGSAYPSVMAYSAKKNVYTKLRGVYNKQNFEQFVKNLLASKESFLPIQKIPKINQVKPWDGEDHKLEQNINDDF